MAHTDIIPEDKYGKPIPYEAQIKRSDSITNHLESNPVATASASNNVDVSVNITIEVMFENVRKDIEDNLDGVMKDGDYQDLLSKISELEDIQKTEPKRGKKWTKTKGIFDWLTGQGVDVFVKVAPLIMKMMENPI